MNADKVLQIELDLYEACEDYITNGSEPKDEVMEACYKAFAAVQEYRILLRKKEKENASGGTST